MTATPQAPDASNNPVQPPTGPHYIPQQQGAGNVPPWNPQMPQGLPPRPTNNAATTGFVLALIAAVVACIPLLGTLSWILAPIGIVFAAVGLYRATPSRGGVGRTMAIWGVVLGVLALIICSVYVTAIAKSARSASSPTSSSSGYSAPYTYTAPAPAYTPPSYSSGSSSGSYSSSSGDSASTPAPDPNTFTAGTYEVGTEIQPGTYKTTGSSYCYYERDKNLDGEIGSIIDNDIVQGQGVMQVKSSDKYIKFSGTCTWTKK
ncbi:MAG TPA: DUF4190 domain-containing protein [Actinomycetospora sp.]|uniref:DUF4190 domain-containing protein n=1 Tax=Actinomycetospora sp. TaxID=1872135 RepID=UPI002F416A69